MNARTGKTYSLTEEGGGKGVKNTVGRKNGRNISFGVIYYIVGESADFKHLFIQIMNS